MSAKDAGPHLDSLTIAYSVSVAARTLSITSGEQKLLDVWPIDDVGRWNFWETLLCSIYTDVQKRIGPLDLQTSKLI